MALSIQPQADQPLAALVKSGGAGSLINSIIQQEGGSPQGVANNPGNIKFTGAPGQIDSGVRATDGGTFASYATPEAGRDAIGSLITRASGGQLPAYGADPSVQRFLATYQGKAGGGGGAFGPSTQSQEAFQQVRAAQHQQADKLDAQAKALIREIDKQSGDVTTAMERVRKAQDASTESLQATLKAVQSPPKQPEVDAMQKFGGLATVVGILGGLLTKSPMRASINAGAAAIEAYNTRDDIAYHRAFDQWKTQTDMMKSVADMQLRFAHDILDDEKLGLDERRLQLDLRMRAMGMSDAADKLRTQSWEDAVGFWQTYDKANAELAKAQAHVVAQENTKWGLAMGTDPNGKTVQVGFNPNFSGEAAFRDLHTGGPLGYVPSNIQPMGRGGSGTIGSMNQYGDPPAGASPNPNKPTEGSNIPESVWNAATQYVLTGHMPPMGNSQANRALIMSAAPWVMAARGMTPADVVQQGVAYAGALSGERTLATRLANLTVGLSEVPPLGEQVIARAKEVHPSTELMDVNRLIQAYELRTGDPKVVQLGAAMNSYLQGLARAINPQGVISDDIRAHVDRVLNQALSVGQIEAGVEQLNQEMFAMQKGLQVAAAKGKTMFPLPGEPPPPDPMQAPDPGSVHVPKAKYSQPGTLNGQKTTIYSDDGTNWYDRDGNPVH